MKILLIVPPNYSIKINGRYNFNINFPLGLAYIAAIAEQEGHDVEVMDCVAEGWETRLKLEDGRIRIGISIQEVEARIKKFAPDIVGISILFSVQTDAAFEIADSVKKVSCNSVTIVGGAQATSQPRETLMCKSIDYIAMGEGELIFRNFLRYIDKQDDPRAIFGIAYCTEDGEVKINQRAEFITDLDLLPFPARNLFDMKLYFSHSNSHGTRKYPRYATVITSRGCPARCTFCNVHELSGRKYRYRSPENVLQELKLLKDNYDIQEILFEDDNLTASGKRASRLFTMMKEARLGIEWDTPNGVAVFALDDGILDLMKSSGCYKINIAIESADQEVIDKIIKKPIRLEKAVSLIKYARKIGLEVQAFFIIGLPGTKLEQMRKNFTFMHKHNMHRCHTSILVPYPGTELYNLCIEKEYFTKNFNLRYATPDYCYLDTPDWKGKDVERLLEKEAFKSIVIFYLKNPLKIIDPLKRGALVFFMQRCFSLIFSKE